MLSSSPIHLPYPSPSPPSPLIANASALLRVPSYGGGGGGGDRSCRPLLLLVGSCIPSLGVLIPFPRKKPYYILSADAAAAIDSKQEAWRVEQEEEDALPSGLHREWLPRHVAVIMDGNSQWAKARGLPTLAGHEAGYRALREMLRLSCPHRVCLFLRELAPTQGPALTPLFGSFASRVDPFPGEGNGGEGG